MKSSRVALCVLLVLVQRFDLAAAAEKEPPAVAPPNPVGTQSLDRLSATLDRPLFSPSRRPPAPPPPPRVEEVAAPPPPPPSPPNLVLYGVVMDGESARAVVRGADNKMLRAQIGDDIEGWKVSQIEGRKVVLSLDGRFATFTLFNHDREAPQAPPVPQNESKKLPVQQATTQIVAQQPAQPGMRRRSPVGQ